LIDDVVTFKAVRELSVTPALSPVPVVLSAVLKITVAIQFWLGKLDEASVAWAKYCNGKVVVVFIVPPEQVLVVVKAVAI
jgi:hypothetical protein